MTHWKSKFCTIKSFYFEMHFFIQMCTSESHFLRWLPQILFFMDLHTLVSCPVWAFDCNVKRAAFRTSCWHPTVFCRFWGWEQRRVMTFPEDGEEAAGKGWLDRRDLERDQLLKLCGLKQKSFNNWFYYFLFIYFLQNMHVPRTFMFLWTACTNNGFLCVSSKSLRVLFFRSASYEPLFCTLVRISSSLNIFPSPPRLLLTICGYFKWVCTVFILTRCR